MGASCSLVGLFVLLFAVLPVCASALAARPTPLPCITPPGFLFCCASIASAQLSFDERSRKIARAGELGLPRTPRAARWAVTEPELAPARRRPLIGCGGARHIGQLARNLSQTFSNSRNDAVWRLCVNAGMSKVLFFVTANRVGINLLLACRPFFIFFEFLK